MKKSFLFLALLFTVLSSNLALAGSQSYTSPWRKPYDEGESGYDRMEVNINSFCGFFEVTGSFNPTITYPSMDTYMDLAVYNTANSSPWSPVYSYLYASYGPYNTSIYYSESGNTWGQALVYMNISNGSGNVTVNWY
jgi:hypothetical protein